MHWWNYTLHAHKILPTTCSFVDDRGAIVDSASLISLTMDGTTKVSTTEQESLFVRTVSSGQVKSSFLALKEHENTTGEELHKVVNEVLL